MGKNPIQKIGYGNIAGLALIALSVLASIGLFTGAQFGGGPGTGSNASTAVIGTICNVFNTIKDAIFILGLALMVLGGAIYAGANLMPSQSRGGFQGYGMAMVVGGIIGVAIAVAAPFILNTIVSASGASGQQIVNGTGSGVITGFGGQGVQASAICAQFSNGFGGFP